MESNIENEDEPRTKKQETRNRNQETRNKIEDSRPGMMLSDI